MRREICAKDCCVIECSDEETNALFHFVRTVEPLVYSFSNTNEDKEPIVYFDYAKRRWFANRYIGECEFQYNNQVYLLKIVPRFGNELMLRLFEHIYSTKLPPSYHSVSKIKDLDIHKLFISFIWLSLLKKAFKHGLLQENRKINEQGNTIRGKFLVQKSLLSIPVKNSLHYQYSIKDINNIPNKILYKAYEILKKDYYLSDSFISEVIKADLRKLSQLIDKKSRLNSEQYKKIKYRSLFSDYKPLVDLSWEIINSKELSIDVSAKLGNSFFLDMAEIWEVFVRKVMDKNLKLEEWELQSSSYTIYKDNFYKRKLIPDIVFNKGNKVLIVDAKYKRMYYNKWDVDREDLFQIHTYSYFFDNSDTIVYSSLVYPLEKELIEEDNYNLFSHKNQKNKFFIEGIEVQDATTFDYKIERFIKSILSKTL